MRHSIPNQLSKNPYFRKNHGKGFTPVPKKNRAGDHFILRKEGLSLSLDKLSVNGKMLGSITIK